MQVHQAEAAAKGQTAAAQPAAQPAARPPATFPAAHTARQACISCRSSFRWL